MDYGNEHFNFPFSRVVEFNGTRLNSEAMELDVPYDDLRITTTEDPIDDQVDQNIANDKLLNSIPTANGEDWKDLNDKILNQKEIQTKVNVIGKQEFPNQGVVRETKINTNDDAGDHPTKKRPLEIQNSNDLKSQEPLKKKKRRTFEQVQEFAEARRIAKLNRRNEIRLNAKAKRMESLREEIDNIIKALFKDKNSKDPNLKKRLTELLTTELNELAIDVEKGLKPTTNDKILANVSMETMDLEKYTTIVELINELKKEAEIKRTNDDDINTDSVRIEILSKIEKQQQKDSTKTLYVIIKEMLKPDPYSNIVESIRTAREALKKVEKSAFEGDEDRVDEAINTIQVAKNRIKALTRNEAMNSDDSEKKIRFENLVANLDESYKSLPVLANDVVSISPNDELEQKKLHDNIANVENVLDQILDFTNASLLAQTNNVAKQENCLEGNVAIGNSQGVIEALKAISIETKKLSAHIAESDLLDPARKNQLKDALKILEENFPKQDKLAKDAMSNPNDQGALEKLYAITKSSLVTLAYIQAIINPSLRNKLAALAKEKQIEDMSEISEGNMKIEEKQKEINGLLERAINSNKNSTDQETLHDIQENLNKLSNQLVNATNPIDNEVRAFISRKMAEQLQKAVDIFQDSIIVKALIENKKVRNFGIKLENVVRDDASSLTDLLMCANDFFNSLNRLIVQVRFVLESQHGFSTLSHDEKAALDLDLRFDLDDLMISLEDTPNDPILKRQLPILLVQLDKKINIIQTMDDKINALIEIENDKLDNFEKAQLSGTSKKCEESFNDLEKRSNELMNTLMMEVSKKSNSIDPRRSEIFSNFAIQFSNQLSNLQKASSISKQEGIKKEMKKELQIVKEVLKTDPYSDIIESIRKAGEGIKKVEQSVNQRDQNGVEEGLNTIQAAKNKFKELTQKEAMKFDDPEKKTKLEILVFDLEKAHEAAKADLNFHLFKKCLILIFDQFRNSSQASFWYLWFKVLVFNEGFGNMNEKLPQIILKCFEMSSLFSLDIFDIEFEIPRTITLNRGIPGIGISRDRIFPNVFFQPTFAGIPLYQRPNCFKPIEVQNLKLCNQSLFNNISRIHLKQQNNWSTVASLGVKIGNRRYCLSSGHLFSAQPSKIQLKNIQQELCVSVGQNSKQIGSIIPQVTVNEQSDFLLVELDDQICFRSEKKVSKILTRQDLDSKSEKQCIMQSPSGELRIGFFPNNNMPQLTTNGIKLDSETHRIISNTPDATINLKLFRDDETLNFELVRANFRTNHQIAILLDELPMESEVIVKSLHFADWKYDISKKWIERQLFEKESGFPFLLQIDLEELTFQNSTTIHFSLRFNVKAEDVNICALSFVPFAMPGDSGSLVSFEDVENKKKIEAFGIIRSADDSKDFDRGIFVVALLDHIAKEISTSFPDSRLTHPRRMHSLKCDFNFGKTQQEIDESGTKTCSSAEKTELNKRPRPSIQFEIPEQDQESKRQKT